VAKQDSKDKPPQNDPDTPMPTTAEVAAVVKDVQRAHRSRIRWGIGKHTAELALRAIEDAPPRRARRASSKSRRRKRHKRML
jgi:hypothetical protein